MSAHFKAYDPIHVVGEWRNGPDVTVVAKFLRRPEGWIVDEIETDPAYRGQGYASRLLKEVADNTGFPVRPFAIKPESQGFWDKLKERGISQ